MEILREKFYVEWRTSDEKKERENKKVERKNNRTEMSCFSQTTQIEI